MDINALRTQIDQIDAEIVKLFERRMQVAQEIAGYKKQNNLPLYDVGREETLLQSRTQMLQDAGLSPYVKQLFKTLMELSKGYQHRMTSEKNIVLIGLMGSGKSSKGKLLAERLGMRFVDVDEEIERTQGMTIAEIFEHKGKIAFREIEHKIIADISGEKRCVISTGGGVVLSETNMKKLKENGTVVFLNRDVDATVKTIDTDARPLLKDGAQKLFEIYDDRLPLYRKWQDIEIAGEFKTVEDAVDKMIGELF